MLRKRLAVLLCAVFVMVLLSVSVIAADYPTRSPQIVVGYGAGGGTDTAVRPIIAEMENYWGRSITVVNMPGADSAVAAEYVKDQPADGYTMFATGNSAASVMLRLRGLTDTNWREWETLMTVVGPSLLVVDKSSDIEDMDDLLDFIRTEEIVVGVTGLGSEPHLFTDETHSLANGKEITYVPYGGCHPAAVATVRGEVDLATVALSATLDFVRAGEVRPIVAFGVSEPVVLEINGVETAVPNIGSVFPAAVHLENIQESWPIYIPRDVPAEIRKEIREAFEWAVQQESVQEYARNNGLQVSGVTGEGADEVMSYVESSVGWSLADAGIAEIHPSEFDIPHPDNWVWPEKGYKSDF